MKNDLDRLMEEKDLAALVVIKTDDYSAAFDYLVGNVHVTSAFALKKPNTAPMIVANPMEVEEAAITGFEVKSWNDYDYMGLMKAAENDFSKVIVAMMGRALKEYGVENGKIGIYGTGDFNFGIEFYKLLTAAYPEYEFVGEMGHSIFNKAGLTKDADELDRIRSVAKRTNAVMQATWDFIGTHKADGDTVVNGDGKPLTIGDVKSFVLRELLSHGLEDIGMIFAQGRDGGFPHSRGQADMELKTGQAIVFDLFPREIGGGYHHDMTRTWSIGYATDEVQAVYDTVMEAFDISVETYGLNKPTHLMQEAVLDYFEGKDHPTRRSHPGQEAGYHHGLGHGIGLNIHESPRITEQSQEDIFEVGNVITIEPGLYYPEKGYGCRIEDSFIISEDGSLESISDFHKELVLPLSE